MHAATATERAMNLRASASRAARPCRAVASAGAAALLLFVSTASGQATDAVLDCAKDPAAGGWMSTSATRLTTESRLHQASFETRDWSGRLRAVAVERSGALAAGVRWDASIAGAGQRRILTSSGVTSGIDFTWQALGAAGMQALLGDIETLNYLRGDQSAEAPPGVPGGLRRRSSRLGAIVNSRVVLAADEDFGHEALVDPADPGSPESVAGLAYSAYLRAKAKRAALVLVGANDGMLHGFDAASGVERFAFVPRTLLAEPNSATDPRSALVRLADPAFAPRFYVDGSPSVGDAYWGGAWRTVVVGTTGVGGKGVFALDISDPGAMSAGKVLWDIDGRTDANLGYTVGEAVIGRLHDGNFYALFGNGPGSALACPVLYLVRLPDGQLRRVPTGGRSAADSCAGAPNGLGRPSLYGGGAGAAAGRSTAFVYAGDLQGNLWRFDLRGVDLRAEPASGARVERLFTATGAGGQPLPAAGPIQIGAAPASVAQAGIHPQPPMLWFGTGRPLATDDRSDTTRQTVYGIVDRFAGPVSRGDLEPRTVAAGGSGATVGGARVDYAGAAAGRRQHGWVLDLPGAGERLASMALVRQGRLLFASLLPDRDRCFAGTSSIYALDAHHGVALSRRIFVGHPDADYIGSTAGIVHELVHVDAGPRAFLFAAGSGPSGTGGALQLEQVLPLGSGAARGRSSWREILR
jgi:type IV pilus assembly protein PilY1